MHVGLWCLTMVGMGSSKTGSSKTLPVLMPTIPGQRWSCHSCGKCCRSLVGHLTAKERDRLDEQGWRKTLGVEPYVKVGRQVMLNKRADGTCVFLDDNNYCMIHSQYGEAAKPLACRVFPFSLRSVPGAWQATFRFDCPSATSSRGQTIHHYASSIQSLASELTHNDSARKTELRRGIVATTQEIDAIVHHFSCWFDRKDVSFLQKVTGASRVTNTLSQAKLKEVRGKRFVELLELLFGDLPTDLTTTPNEASRRQQGLLRQLAFAHSEHVMLSELAAGRWYSFRKRMRQLASAKRFLRGKGTVPRIVGYDDVVHFDAIERVACATSDQESISELMVRYISARLHSRSFCGPGYYGWPAIFGLAALWLSMATAGWLARYVAVARRREAIIFDDVARAIGMVDRAATRLPALGNAAEKARLKYLSVDDGITKLLQCYRLI